MIVSVSRKHVILLLDEDCAPVANCEGCFHRNKLEPGITMLVVAGQIKSHRSDLTES